MNQPVPPHLTQKAETCLSAMDACPHSTPACDGCKTRIVAQAMQEVVAPVVAVVGCLAPIEQEERGDPPQGYRGCLCKACIVLALYAPAEPAEKPCGYRLSPPEPCDCKCHMDTNEPPPYPPCERCPDLGGDTGEDEARPAEEEDR